MENNKLTDERLKIKRLKNTRILFNIQTSLIIATIIFQTVLKGISSLQKNPLMFIFLITTVIMSFQEMGISKDTTVIPTRSLLSVGKGLLSVLIVGIIVFFFFNRDGSNNALLYFGIFTVAILFVFIVSTFILKRKE